MSCPVTFPEFIVAVGSSPFVFAIYKGFCMLVEIGRLISYSRVGSRGVAAGCFLATPVATPAEGSLCPLATPGLPPGYCRAAARLPLAYRQGGSHGYCLAASRR